MRVADILKHYAADFVRDHRSAAVPQVQSTLAKLTLCRTPALGGHVYACRTCDHRAVVHHSCGDRHCPQCSGAKRRDWLDSSAKLLLPGVTYYQVVFTIPDRLSSLTLGNRRVMFDLLFGSAWRALKQTIEDEQQFEAAAAIVLHTWNQQLDAHVHVHALVPSGGPSLKNPDQWKNARLPAQETPSAHETQNRFWLVDADALRLAFRTAFLGGLRRLHARSKLKLDGKWSPLWNAAAFEDWLQPLENMKWVVYIQPPPTPDTTPDQVLKYLARYMTGGPISDRRLVRHEHGHVTFRARTGTQTGGSDETEDVRIPGVEFVRRWAMHILPKGCTKTRRFGGYSNRHQSRYIADCQKLLLDQERLRGERQLRDQELLRDSETVQQTLPANLDTAKPDTVQADTPSDESPPGHRCPNCEALLTIVCSETRPGWQTVMSDSRRPTWYRNGPYRTRSYRNGWYDDG